MFKVVFYGMTSLVLQEKAQKVETDIPKLQKLYCTALILWIGGLAIYYICHL